MNMNIYKYLKLASVVLPSVALTACNDYLDLVPKTTSPLSRPRLRSVRMPSSGSRPVCRCATMP